MTLLRTRQRRNPRLRRLITPAIVLVAFGYFGYHTFHGDYGLIARYQLEQRITALELERQHVRQQRAALEQRVILLRQGTLDRDMLDERARATLNLLHRNEVLIPVGAEHVRED